MREEEKKINSETKKKKKKSFSAIFRFFISIPHAFSFFLLLSTIQLQASRRCTTTQVKVKGRGKAHTKMGIVTSSSQFAFIHSSFLLSHPPSHSSYSLYIEFYSLFHNGYLILLKCFSLSVSLSLCDIYMNNGNEKSSFRMLTKRKDLFHFLSFFSFFSHSLVNVRDFFFLKESENCFF